MVGGGLAPIVRGLGQPGEVGRGGQAAQGPVGVVGPVGGEAEPAAGLQQADGLGDEVVLHQAALPSVPRSIERPLDTDRVNVFGTLQLLELARRAGSVKRVVFASSSSVYGERHPDDSKVETMTPMPLSPYAVSKLTGEHYLAVYSRLHGLPTVALRYFNVFGPRQDPNSQYAAALPKNRIVAAWFTDADLLPRRREARLQVWDRSFARANLVSSIVPPFSPA